MKFDIVSGFFGQHVEISVRNKTFTGILRQSDIDDSVIDVEPASEYQRKRYGSSVLEVESVTAIRPIKQHIDEDDDCRDEAI